jgi:hypothetical protein
MKLAGVLARKFTLEELSQMDRKHDGHLVHTGRSRLCIRIFGARPAYEVSGTVFEPYRVEEHRYGRKIS